MQAVVPLACFLSMIRPPGVQYESALLQIAPVDKSKCPYVKDNNDVGFQLFTRHNPTAFQELRLGDDEKLFASNIDFNDRTVIYFHAWMEQPDDGSGIMVREAYMQRGDTNVIMVDAHHLEAGPWYFTAAQNTWYIGRFAALFIDYLASRGLNLNNTHLIGHSLGAHAAGVAGTALKSGRVARITGLDPALPLFEGLPLEQRLDTTDAHFVDIIHTDAGIFGYKAQMGHVDFYPNGGISPQPGCELEVVLPKQLLLNKCDKHIHTTGFYTYYLTANQESHLKRKSLESKLENLFAYIHSVKARDKKPKRALDMGDKIEKGLHKNDNNADFDMKYKAIEIKSEKDLRIDENSTNIVPKSDVNTTIDRTVAKDDEFVDKSTEKQSDSITDVLINEEDKTEDYVEDQIAETSEYDITQVEYNQHELKNKGTVSIINDSKEILLLDDKSKIHKEANLKDIKDTNNTKDIPLIEVINKTDKIQAKEEKDTINKATVKSTEKDTSITQFDADFETLVDQDDNFNDKQTDKRASIVKVLNYKDPCEPNMTEKITTEGQETVNEVTENIPLIPTKKFKEQSQKINILNVLGTTYRISRVISSLKQTKPFADKIKHLFAFKNKIEATTPSLIKKIFQNNIGIIPRAKNHVVKRQKRFLPFFKQNDESDSNSILFRMLEFLMKNRKNVLPVFTVMREINTLVKSGNGELNHFTKEQNNYIGATPPVFPPITYSLELGNGNKAVAFVKRLLGLSPKGDRLTITSRK